MRFKLQQIYPASLDDLWAVFSQPDYPERKYRTLGATGFQLLRFSAGPELIEVELERRTRVPLCQIPGWARGFVASEQTLTHYSQWRRLSTDRAAADLRITLAGAPVSVHGTGAIAELSPGRTRMTLQFEVTCRLPLVGGRVAHLVAGQIRQALDADYDYTLRYLEEEINQNCGPSSKR
jgi:hypothetical protein